MTSRTMGTVLVGDGTNPNGDIEAWRAVLAPITITRPLPGELVIAGTQYDILWASSSSIDFLHIEFSDNDGANYSFVATNVPADSNHYEWTVPPALSTRCRIKLTDVNDTLNFAESDSFKVKGYQLTRFKPDGNYEAFKPDIHGWSFANDDTSMWPSTWWGQFDYQSGEDPYTNQPYPNEEPFLSAQSTNFPDWPLFVRAFGVNQSYWNASLGFIRDQAKTKWANIKDSTWKGSCAGFTVSSLLAFDDDQAFLNSFPEMPPFAFLYPLAIGDSVRKVVNQLYVHQFGTEHLAYYNQSNATPRETLQDIMDMLISETGDYRYVVIADTDGAHGVLPYKVEPDPDFPGDYFVYVYDNNYPGDSTKFIDVDSTNNSWSYSELGWGGNSLFDLSDPVSTYLVPPILRFNPGPSMEVITSSVGQDHIQIYNTIEASILITDQSGNTIGFGDSVAFNNLPDGIPIIPITSKYNPPIGYYVPAGEYSVGMDQFTDSSTYFSVFSDSLVYSYKRSDADFNQSDELNYGDGFSLNNPDNQTKTFSLKTIVIEDTYERVFNIIDPEVFQDDSMHFNVLDRQDLKMVKVGSSTSYNINLRQVSAVEDAQFNHSNIILESNSSHRIVPDWDDLQNQLVTIYIDLGNDGTIDDTLMVENQPTGIDDEGLIGIPDEYNLAQNYPNPFNPVTIISYSLPHLSDVTLKVYNILGQEVITLVNEQQPAGNYEVSFDAANLSSGIYLYKIQAGPSSDSGQGYTDVKKMILLR